MKTVFLLMSFFMLFVRGTQQPVVYKVEPKPNQDVAYEGDLSQGVFLDDLSWAWSSQNACFPATVKNKFNGKHLFFTGIIPKYSEITVTVIPEDKNADFSVYAYVIGENSNHLVPDLPRSIRCVSDYNRERPIRGKMQDHTRKVDNLVALNRPYRFVIGVTGADGLAEGKFTIVLSTKSR